MKRCDVEWIEEIQEIYQKNKLDLVLFLLYVYSMAYNKNEDSSCMPFLLILLAYFPDDKVQRHQ